MSEAFLGEIRMFSCNFAPKGWALCNGQLLPINQNQALFALLGTTYGGNGQTNFALPDLRGRVPIHFGAGYVMGQRPGTAAHTLSIPELPSHTHILRGTAGNATTNQPAGNLPASPPSALYRTPQSLGPNDALVAMSPAAVTNIGGSQAHNNTQPYQVVSFCIALQGIFPSQN